MVAGDPTRLRQVINNLVGNAVKFTERGEVVVEVVAGDREPQRRVLHFTISDTGIGIPPDQQQKVFQAFCQADSSTTRSYGGTGLGLTVSSRLVSMMGGEIWLESEVGHGSRFHFTVSLAVAREATGLEAISNARLAGQRTLVVDDNATNRHILTEMLKNWDMPVTAADGAKAALEFLRAAAASGSPYRLMVTDGHMPEMDGAALVSEVRQTPGLVESVVMLTSAGQRGDAARCRELGVAAYLTKPIRRSELREALLRVLDQSGPRQNAALITRHSLRERRASLPRHVLIAEDNPVNQKLAVRLLEKAGCTTRVVASGREALSALDEEEFDLVLMDVQMPEMDGFEATAAIREREKRTGAHLPVVALTAHAIKGDEQRCHAAGMDAYLSKPVQAQQLIETLDAFCLSRRQVSPMSQEQSVTRVAGPDN